MLRIEKNNPILSVGMIIKNEEKVIERCLNSLIPLFESIPCELIIADTGSVDSSIEIASKYTDNIFGFEWINDFSAARNSTLEKAKGRWFFFLDADEYLDDDISELVSFFCYSNECNNYNSMSIHFRNYNDREKRIYKDSYLTRFFRLSSDSEPLKFIGEIHETIPVKYPRGKFETIVHHTGYCYNTKQYYMKKNKRNHIPMRQEFLDFPSIRMATMLLETGKDYPDECEEYISYGMEYLKNHKNDFYGKDFIVKVIKFYMHTSPNYALKICDMYYNLVNDTATASQTVAVEMYRTEILYNLFQYEDVISYFCIYENLYKKCVSGELPVSSDTGFSIRGTMEIDYIGVTCLVVQSLTKTCKYAEAKSMLDKLCVEEKEDESYKTLLKCWVELAERKKDYSILSDVCKKITNTNNKNKINYMNTLLHDVYSKIALDEERKKFAEVINEEGLTGIYADILKLIINPEKTKIQEFINGLDEWTVEYSELIYLAIKNNCDISGFSKIISHDQYEESFKLVVENHDDFAEAVLCYEYSSEYLLNINLLGLIVELHKYVALNCEMLNDNQKYVLYKRYISLLGDYVMNLYNDEFLNEKYIFTLPGEHQFGFYMYNAETAWQNNDMINYIREMKKALISYEKSNDIIKFLTRHIR